MPRCPKHRCCRRLEGERVFKPRAVPMHACEVTRLGADEFEALRLCDVEGRTQAEAGEAMGVSRGTVQRLLETGRRKLVTTLLHNGALAIDEPKERT